MQPKAFSLIVLTYNEEIHLPRLLASMEGLEYDLFVLDSGSNDQTIPIAESYGAQVLVNPFENHPKQWDFALQHFKITTPWIIGLDADHIILPELFQKLASFDPDQIPDTVNGIYFNRKNYFKGRWIRRGGYFPKYMLKMFRTGMGYSDLNENMDHRFIAPGETIVWKDGYLKEENLKENDIGFWIQKHNRYANLVAREEMDRMESIRTQTIQPKLFGTPDQRTAWLKNRWWQLPLYWRPFFYFVYRFFLMGGIFDGREGRIFHFLQAYWFRLLVDIKIDELRKKNAEKSASQKEQSNA